MKHEIRGKPPLRDAAMQIVNSALLGKRVVAGGNAADIDNGHRLRKLGGRYAAVLQQRRQKQVVRRRQPWHQRIRPALAIQAIGVQDRMVVEYPWSQLRLSEFRRTAWRLPAPTAKHGVGRASCRARVLK